MNTTSRWNNLSGNIALVLGLISVMGLSLGHAQETATSVQSAPPDDIVQIVADAAGLPLLSPTDLSSGSTYWVIVPGYGGNVNALPYPCLPGNWAGSSIYSITGNILLVDMTGGQVLAGGNTFGAQANRAMITSALGTQASTVANLIERIQGTTANTSGGMLAMDASSPMIPGTGGGTNSGGGFYSDSFNFHPDYGTNLWIANFAVSSGNATGIISNSPAGVLLELQYTTDLTQPWQSAQPLWRVYGSELTNWTAFSVPGISSSNLFLRVRSWADDGSGLPIWWQLQYFGYVGVDPNAQDPAGDGWSNWQKFQMGVAPNVFVTPPMPQGVTAQFNPNNSSQIILTWQPNNGPVTGYTITRLDYSNGQWTTATFNVGVTNEFVDTNFPAYTDANAGYPSVYEIQADYAGGGSAWNYWTSPYSQTAAPYVIGLPGASGAMTLLVNHIPPGVSSMRLIRNDGGGATTNMVFPVSDFTNGIFTIPSALTYPGSPEFYLQAVWPDGSKSAAVSPALMT